jgi:hypothetical protein
MKNVVERFLSTNPDLLLREALSLAALCTMILATLCLPVAG